MRTVVFVLVLIFSGSSCFSENDDNYRSINKSSDFKDIAEFYHKYNRNNAEKLGLKDIVRLYNERNKKEKPKNITQPKNANNNIIRFLAFGDFGKNNPMQVQVAGKMAEDCKKNNCSFALTLGDNIYPGGIASDKKGNPDYSLIHTNFTQNFNQVNIPMYMILGNHDLGYGGRNIQIKNFFRRKKTILSEAWQKMQNQIKFTEELPKINAVNTLNKNPRVDDHGYGDRLWNLSDAYYTKHFDDAKISLFALDTNYYPNKLMLDKEKPLVSKNKEQEKWLKGQLTVSKNKWKIVIGHVPLFSHGSHGAAADKESKNFRENILAILCKNEVDLYLAGHEHVMELSNFTCKAEKNQKPHIIGHAVLGAVAKSSNIKHKSLAINEKFSKALNNNIGKNELLWANGIFKEGAQDFKIDNGVTGFASFEVDNIRDEMKINMHIVSSKISDTKDACFTLKKGEAIKACEAKY
jgi:tartrate-resistant acid phosphatase type 5